MSFVSIFSSSKNNLDCFLPSPPPPWAGEYWPNCYPQPISWGLTWPDQSIGLQCMHSGGVEITRSYSAAYWHGDNDSSEISPKKLAGFVHHLLIKRYNHQTIAEIALLYMLIIIVIISLLAAHSERHPKVPCANTRFKTSNPMWRSPVIV